MRWWWETLPRSVSRAAPMGHIVLTDGSYVRAYPGGALAPLAAFGLGLLLGWRPWEDTYATFSYSVGLAAGLVVVGVLGASLGLAAWVGWCVGDWFLATVPLGTYSALGRVIVDLLLAVAMVVVPIVAQGLRSRTEQLTMPFVGSVAEWLGWVAFALTAGVGVYVWQLSVPQLVRPLWVFDNVSPELPAIEPFQRDVGITTTSFEGVGFLDGLTSSSLFWFVLLAAGVRAVLATVAAHRDPLASQPIPPAPPWPAPPTNPALRDLLRQPQPAASRSPHHLPPQPTASQPLLAVNPSEPPPPLAARQSPHPPPLTTPPAGAGQTRSLPLVALTAAMDPGAALPPGPWAGAASAALKAVASALAVALVLAGITTTTLPEFASRQWLGMFAAFALAALVRSVGLAFLPGYVRLVNRVPVVVRIVACVLVAQTIAKDLVEDALLANDTDFSSLLLPMLVSVGMATLLIPGRRPSDIAMAGAPA